MRSLLLALLLVVPLLAGCLGLPPPEPTEPVPLVAGPAVLPLPEIRAATGAQGFWVPAGTERLSMRWDRAAPDADPPEQKSDDVHEERPDGVLSHLDDLLIVLGPNDTRLHVGTPSLRLYTAPEAGGAGTANATHGRNATLPREVFLDILRPTPGAYRLITLGAIPLPHVSLQGAPADALVLVPLPVTVTRTTLIAQDGPLAAPLDAEGGLELAAGTVAVWGGITGVGADVRLEIQNEDGARVAHLRRAVLAEPNTAGLGAFTLGFGRIFEESSSEPALLGGKTLEWSIQGTGIGTAYAYAAVVAELPRSAARLADETDLVPLEGRLGPRQAGGFILPADAGIIVRQAGTTTARDHVSYRIYDMEGKRLHTGATADSTQVVVLPPGPIAILNDGPGDLEVAIAGALPTDAVLHPLEAITKTYNIQLGEIGGGAAENSLRATFDGPLTMLYYSSFGTLDDIYVQVHRDDGAPLLSIPDLAASPPGDAACCTIYGFGSKGADAPWVDPGIHRVALRSEAGEGQISLSARYVDLTRLLTLGTSEEQDGK